jgi:uncharacterized membrane protein
MSAAGVIIGLWVLFALTHMGLSSRAWRPRLVATLGARAFLGAYSLLAIAIFTALVWFYMLHRHEGASLWTPSIGTAGLWLIYGLQGVAWVLVVAGVMTPSPAAFAVGEAPPPSAARGIHLVTRHPVFMGAGLFGALHLFVAGFASDVAFWAGFPLFALIGCAHQDRRKLATEGSAYRDWHARTPFLPFTGRETLRGVREMPPLAIAIGVALATGLRLLHAPLFH